MASTELFMNFKCTAIPMYGTCLQWLAKAFLWWLTGAVEPWHGFRDSLRELAGGSRSRLSGRKKNV